MTSMTPCCKCCLGETRGVGTVNWSRLHTEKPDPGAGDLVPYYACGRCGFLFSTVADGWDIPLLRERIYKPERYSAAGFDPDAHGSPPESVATEPYRMGVGLSHYFSGGQEWMRILDFGSGGNPGPIGQAFRDQGFRVDSYDPFVPDIAILPEGAYDLILMIEVIEHCTDLDHLLRTLRSRLNPRGVLWIQTLLHHDVSAQTLESWYVTPRNGHFSIFTLEALWFLFRRAGINIVQHPFARSVIGFVEKPSVSLRLFV
ncbi:MAG: class I SAM-dependent methyltransferase [Rhodospirillales bacterium]|nr:class I SAM-dependent methyltransferase [Rhodospirillales bacterium]